MTKLIREFMRDDSGAAAAEYVLLLAVLGGGIAAGALYFGGKINGSLTAKGDYLEACAKDKTAAAC